MSEASTFWARRRAAVEAEAQADERAEEARQVAARAEALAEKDDQEVLAEMGLPDPAEMQAGDDFSAFMARDVPEHLRKQALRTLWRSNPVLACVDGLNEYDDDYRAAMLLQEPIKTAYRVGKGMLKHIEEMQRQEVAAQDPPEEDADLLEVDGADVECAEPDDLDERATAEYESVVETAEEVAEMPAPRRMRFRFEGAVS